MEDIVKPIPYADFQRKVLALYLPPLRAKATYTKIAQVLKIAGNLVGPEGTTADLTTDLIARLIASRPEGQSANSTASLLSAFRACCSLAASEGWVRRSPFDARKTWIRASKPAHRQHHSREDIAKVLALAALNVKRKRGWARWRAMRIQAIACTVAYTGMRKNEAMHLRQEDVDFEHEMIFIVERLSSRLKTVKSAAPVPMPAALVPVLKEWIATLEAPVQRFPIGEKQDPGAKHFLSIDRPIDLGWLFPNVYRTGPWVGGSTGFDPLDRLKALGAQAGVEGFTFQSLRHSYATHAELWGMSDAQIQRVLRHTSTRTQWHYRHSDTANLRAMVKGITFGDPANAPAPDPEPEAPAAAAAVIEPRPPAPPAPLAALPASKAPSAPPGPVLEYDPAANAVAYVAAAGAVALTARQWKKKMGRPRKAKA